MYFFLHLFIHHQTHVLASVEDVAMNVWVPISLPDSNFISIRYIPKSENSGSYGSCTFRVIFFGKKPCSVSILVIWNYVLTNSAQMFTFLHILPILIISFLLIIVILTSVMWFIIVVLICISLMISDLEHFLMYMFTICKSSLKKFLSSCFAHF